MNSYDVIARFYDAFVGDPAEKATWLKQLIQKHQSNAKNVLELACGTGSVLKYLSADYQVTGLDNSAGMLHLAQEKLPSAMLIEADMSNFDLPAKFDVVICVYDSINHLLQFSQWESMFSAVAQHLNSNGLFIFDMNTVEFLEKLNRSEPSVSTFEGDNTLKVNARPDETALTVLKIEVTEDKGDGSTESHTSNIPETSFSLSQVKAALGRDFDIIDQLDERAYKNENYDSKVFFVCRLANHL
jgi:predicted TPR repeat methyltransferase